MKEAKRKYFDNEFLQTGNQNPKHMWKVIDRPTNNKKDLSSPSDISSDEFNKHFSLIGSSTVQSLVDDTVTIPWRNPPCRMEFSFSNIQDEAVMKGLVSLGNDSANDVLGFDAKLLALSAQLITPFLTSMFNLSLMSANVLNDWKMCDTFVQRQRSKT